MPTLRHRLTPNDLERGIRGVESPVLVFSGRYRDISGFTLTADCHFYFWLITPFYFRLLPRCLTQSTYFRKNVNVILHLPTLYKLTCIGKFMYMQACLTCSIIICMHGLPILTLKHCHIVAMGMTLPQSPSSLSST